MKQKKANDELKRARDLFDRVVANEAIDVSDAWALGRIQIILRKAAGGEEVPDSMYREVLGVSAPVFKKLSEAYLLATMLPEAMRASGEKIRQLEDRLNPPGEIGGLHDYAYRM